MTITNIWSLPKNFLHLIASIEIKADTIYGADRLMYPTIKDYLTETYAPNLLCWNPNENTGQLPAFWVVPHGYFQYYKSYNKYSNSKDAEKCDGQFAGKFKNKVNLLLL